jgi:uncharacterized protein YjbJ (UPF0337 family)
MAATDKVKNTAQQAKGEMKEQAGDVTGNDRLRRKGQADQVKARIKKAGEKVKDTFRRR